MNLAQVTEQVIAGDRKKTEDIVKLALESNEKSQEILDALMKGIYDIGKKWARYEVFIPEVLKASNAMKAGMKKLEPYLKKEGLQAHRNSVVLGTVKGDQHDIGKNIVGTMLISGGFDVHDIGVDKPAALFVEKAREVNADVIAASSLLTTTMQGQKDIIDLLESIGERGRFRVMVGGGPVTKEWADSIGADAYGETAAEAIQIAKTLIDGSGVV